MNRKFTLMPCTTVAESSPQLVSVPIECCGGLEKMRGFVGAYSSAFPQPIVSLNSSTVGGMTAFRTDGSLLKAYPQDVAASANGQLAFSAVDKKIPGHDSDLTATPNPLEWFKKWGK